MDACGLQCPGPIMRLKTETDKLGAGEQLFIKATDPGFFKDVKSWCDSTGNTLVSCKMDKGIVEAVIEKPSCLNPSMLKTADKKNKTFIVFSDDFDRALASFVLANGAAATGSKVTMFFTFWGLNVIKKKKKPKVKKDFMGKMFSNMLPSSSEKLKLSKMNMGGMGSKMMRNIMKDKNIDSLESMLQAAIDANVNIIACQMSMDVMGVKKEELIDEAKIGGVATYMAEAEQAGVNLFI